ncbi:divergent polysaccharide deacetylase family protein [Aureimonas pseudogalii]|uniref:Divergent polysaccharide deacetylase family protein n=1 Tax=Aureimonas pseudogalii TaxID=1744844 RepID=A0A7W6H7B2_9HYPH|nr:divergent polysaccharide deacetylase family protein [Aureimonas pseudogalii]MBB3999903.1 hypothetical protein [Aureimonas pseudogalii]
MHDELYRPLGQNLTSTSPRDHRRWRTAGVAAMLVAGLAGGSAFAVLGQPDFTPPARQAAPVEALAPSRVAAAEGPGPQIVRMEESGGVTITGGDGVPRVDGTTNPYTGSIRVLEPGSLRQPQAFAHLPDQALIEPSDEGPLPIRSGDGRRPLDVYAGTSNGTLGTRIAIVVGGLGISQTGTQQAVERLPAGVTLGFAASGNSLDRWMQTARRNGHELLLQAPLEPFGYPDVSPGEHTLTVADAAARRFEALDWSLGRLTNYVGVMNYMGARFNAETKALEPFLGELNRRGLLYLDDGTSARSQARDVATAGGTPFASADLVLDDDRNPQAIARQLDALERVARARGTAVGVASAFDVTVAAIAAWADGAAARGIEIVPVSALAFDPETKG